MVIFFIFRKSKNVLIGSFLLADIRKVFILSYSPLSIFVYQNRIQPYLVSPMRDSPTIWFKKNVTYFATLAIILLDKLRHKHLLAAFVWCYVTFLFFLDVVERWWEKIFKIFEQKHFFVVLKSGCASIPSAEFCYGFLYDFVWAMFVKDIRFTIALKESSA